MDNYWSEFEYNKLKLLLHEKKMKSIFDVLDKKKECDERFPISIELHLTNCCNLNCPWCTDRILRANRATLDTNIVKSVIRELNRFQVGITLEGGGEPTLHKDFTEIVRYGNELGTDMGLITNGTIDISEVVHMLKWIRISLDSSTKEEYIKEKGYDQFDRVLNNLKKMCALRDMEKTYVGVGYVLTKSNYGELEKLVNRLDAIGVDYIYFRPVEEDDELMPSIEELYDLKKELVHWTQEKRIKYSFHIADRIVKKNAGLCCVAHSLTSIIHADGNVTMCEKRRDEEIHYGNVYENSFENIWNSNMRKEMTQKLLQPENQSGCSVCRITAFNQIIDDLRRLNTKNFI